MTNRFIVILIVFFIFMTLMVFLVDDDSHFDARGGNPAIPADTLDHATGKVKKGRWKNPTDSVNFYRGVVR